MENKYGPPKYSRSDAENFCKIINRYMSHSRFFEEMKEINKALKQEDYYAFILALACILDKENNLYVHNTKSKKIYYEKLIRSPLEEMPLLINNEDPLVRKIVKWRLKVGK